MSILARCTVLLGILSRPLAAQPELAVPGPAGAAELLDQGSYSERLSRALESLAPAPAPPVAAQPSVDVSPAATDSLLHRLIAELDGTLLSEETSWLSATGEGLLPRVEAAIGVYMRTLGEIRWELERRGLGREPGVLHALDPGPEGSGVIRLVGSSDFAEVVIHFRGAIAAPDGRHPAALVQFHYRPEASGPGLIGRLMVPILRQSYSFRGRVELGTAGEIEERGYGLAPQLLPARAVLEVLQGGQWTRLPSAWQELENPPRRRARTIETCDATCAGSEPWPPG